MGAEHHPRQDAPAQGVDVLPAVDNLLEGDGESALAEILLQEGRDFLLRARDRGDVDEAADVLEKGRQGN
jgi:hypothetical protein